MTAVTGGRAPGAGLARRDPRPAALPPLLDGSVPGAQLVCAAAALLLEAIGSPDAASSAVQRALDLAGRDRALVAFPGPPLPGGPAGAREALTRGETRVLRYLPTNLPARKIAEELYLSVNTVKTHQRHLYQKLGARSRHEAVQRARALGLLGASPRRP